MEIRKIRDLTLVSLSENQTMVIACDSSGGIGMKEGDALRVPSFYTGKFTCRVALLEVLSAGAEVITITNAVCAEMNPTGTEIIKGIYKELEEANIEKIVLTGSTEENFKTISTGVGITVIGIVNSSAIKVNSTKKDAMIISIGFPKVGSEIDLEGDPEIFSYKILQRLLQEKAIQEIVPVGSKGILYEAEELAKNNNLQFIVNKNLTEIDIKKSAGPATTAIVAVKAEFLETLKAEIPFITVIGQVR